MAILSKSQILALIKEPRAQKEISRAKQKRTRHRLHTEPETDQSLSARRDCDTNFLGWVKGLLKSEDNFARFCELYRQPVPTCNLVESIYSEFEKVFQGANAFERFVFTDPELEQDFTAYRKKLGDFNFWETQGFETFKNSIDNILVVDLPKLQRDEQGGFISESDRPEPYYYLLDIDNLVDIHSTKVRGMDQATQTEFYYFKTEYIIFRSGGLIYAFDDNHFRVYSQVEGEDPVLVDEIPHGLGYTPARSFWTTPLNSNCSLQKRGVLTTSLADLDWLLFFTLAERYLQLYAPFPIYAVYKGKCDYTIGSDRNKKRCIDGYLQIEGARTLSDHSERCPKCASKIKIGPGNVMELKMPADKDDVDLLANPLKVIPAEVTSLDYMKAALADMRKDIYVACVGRSQDPQNNQAKNEKQVESGFQSSEAVLLKVKRNFEIAQLFVLDTIARLRYGSAYITGTINYGDEFFTKTEEQEVAGYKTAIDAGLPEHELSTRREDINIARYRDDPKQIERIKILRNLIPFPDLGIDKVRELRSAFPDAVSPIDFVIKINFTAFVDRFEREQANLVLFASAQNFDRKIELIKVELERYATEYLAKIPAPPAPAPKPEGSPAPFGG